MKQNNKKQFEKNGVLWLHCKVFAKDFSEYDERVTIGSIYTTFCELNRKIKNNKILTNREQWIYDCFKKINGLLYVSVGYLDAKYGTRHKDDLEIAYYRGVDKFKNDWRFARAIWDVIKNKKYITQNGKYKGHAISQRTIYMYLRSFVFACEYYNEVFTKAINQLLKD